MIIEKNIEKFVQRIIKILSSVYIFQYTSATINTISSNYLSEQQILLFQLFRNISFESSEKIRVDDH